MPNLNNLARTDPGQDGDSNNVSDLDRHSTNASRVSSNIVRASLFEVFAFGSKSLEKSFISFISQLPLSGPSSYSKRLVRTTLMLSAFTTSLLQSKKSLA